VANDSDGVAHRHVVHHYSLPAENQGRRPTFWRGPGISPARASTAHGELGVYQGSRCLAVLRVLGRVGVGCMVGQVSSMPGGGGQTWTDLLET